jgi:flagellar FliL protein
MSTAKAAPAAANAEKQGDARPDERKKSGFKRLLMVAILLLVVAGAGGGAFWWWRNQQAAQAAGSPAPDAHAAEVNEVSGALQFEPFIVNLADAGASRYLKADIRLLVSGIESVKEIEEDEVVMLRLRSAILEHLSRQTSDAVATGEGKDALKHALAERCTAILQHAKVADVLFAEFVVQY